MILRRLRGLLGIAILWAVAWLPIGIIHGFNRVQDLLPPGERAGLPAVRIVASLMLFWMVFGGVTGVIFAAMVVGIARRGSLERTSTAWLTVVGAIAGAIPAFVLTLFFAPGLSQINWGFAVILTTLSSAAGGVCAAATIALARRGQRSVSAAA